MEEYIKPLQEYLHKNYDEYFGVMIGEYPFDLIVCNRREKKQIMMISTYEYDDEDYEINLFDKCPFGFIDGIVQCLKDFDEARKVNKDGID